MITGLTEKAQDEIMDSLHDSANTLAEEYGDSFCAYPSDLDHFPEQSLSVARSHQRIDGELLDVDNTDIVAGVVDIRYKNLPSAISRYQAENSSLDNIAEVLKSGQNVVIGMDHAELIDIAMAEVGISNHLRRMGVAHRSGLIVSKAVDFLGIKVDSLGIPAEFAENFLNGINIKVRDDRTVTVRDFIKLAADYTYLTVPSTGTFSNIRGLQSSGIKLFNGQVIGQIEKDMEHGRRPGEKPMLLAVAMPGTTTKLLDDGYEQRNGDSTDIVCRSPTEVIGRISPAITKFMQNALTFATTVRLDDELPIIGISEKPICIRSSEDISRFAGALLDLLVEIEPEKKYIYDERGDLPVIRKSMK